MSVKISSFVVSELDYFRTKCNFTDIERELFDYRARGIPLETCAELMNISVSTVKRVSARVKQKLNRV